jgi:hypothetical protein
MGKISGLNQKIGQIVLFLVALVAIYLWVQEHLALTAVGKNVLVIVGAVSAVVSVAGGFLDDDEGSRIKEWLRRVVAPLLRWRALLWMYIVLVVCGCFISSITVSNTYGNDNFRVRTASSAQALAAADYVAVAEDEETTFLKFILPIGTDYTAAAEGYAPEHVTVHPFVSEGVSFTKLPDLFVAMVGAKEMLRGRSLVIYHKGVRTVVDRGDTTAFMLGYATELSEKNEEALRENLASLGVENVDVMLEPWKAMASCKLALVPGDTVRLQVFYPDGVAMSDSTIRVSKSQFQFIYLL